MCNTLLRSVYSTVSAISTKSSINPTIIAISDDPITINTNSHSTNHTIISIDSNSTHSTITNSTINSTNPNSTNISNNSTNPVSITTNPVSNSSISNTITGSNCTITDDTTTATQ